MKRCRFSLASIAKMFVMPAKKELVGHAGDVVADHDVTRDTERLLFMIGRHGAALGEKEMEEPLKACDRVVAVFGDDRMCVNARDEELFEKGVLSGNLAA